MACLGSAAFAALVTGCSAAHVFAPDAPPLSRAASEELCEQANAARPSVTSFRSMAESTITAGRDTVSFRYAIVAREPDSMRIDLLPNEGAFTLGMLTIHGGESQSVNVQEKTFKRSRGGSTALQEFLGMPGASQEVIQALVTGVPPLFDCRRVKLYEEGRRDVTVLDPAVRVAYTIDGDSARVKRFSMLAPDDEAILAEGALYYSRSDSPASMSLAVHEPHEANGVFLFKKITLNPVIDDVVFEVPVPAGYEEEE